MATNGKDETKLPVTTGERVVTPMPLWQGGPPGPAGAAVDPPPCSPGGGIAGIAGPLAGAAEPAFEPLPPLPTNDRFGMLDNLAPDRLKYGPFQDLQTAEPHLGKETSPAELRRLIEKLNHGDTPNAPPR